MSQPEDRWPGWRHLVALSAAVLASMLIASCGGGDAPPTDESTELTSSDVDDEHDEHEGFDPAAAAERPAFLDDYELTPERAAVVAEFEAAVAALRALPAHRITFEGMTDGDRLEGTVELDAATGDFSSLVTRAGSVSAPVGSELIVVGDEMYARIAGLDDLDETAWSAVDIRGRRDEFIDRNYTFDGVIAPSFDRIEVLLRSVPFEATPLGDGRGHSVTFTASDIAWFYLDRELERIASTIVPGEVTFEFRLDDQGTLIGLGASGTHFHDGEPLEDVVADIVYVAIDVPVVVSPESP